MRDSATALRYRAAVSGDEAMAQDSSEWLQRDWLAAGMTLVEQGGRTGKLYVLRSGEVEVIRDGRFVLAIRTPG